MKNFYTYLFILIVSFVVLFMAINNGEKIIKVTNDELVGDYLLKFNKNFYYKLKLKSDNSLTLTKQNKDKIILKKDGTWYFTNNVITVKISKYNTLDFSLGQITKNLFTGKISIEAFSMGEFLGNEDNAFFRKIEE